MTTLKRLFSTLGLTALLALSACGGGGGSAGTSPLVTPPTTGGGTSAAVTDIVLTLSAASVVNTGASNVTATVTALDANRNTVSGAAVALSVNSDAVLAIQGSTGSVTSAAGTLLATVGIGSNRTNRTITVTAASGSITKTATLQVVDTVGTVATVADLVLTLSAANIVNTGAGSVTATVTALDSNRNALAGVAVALSVNNEAVLTIPGSAGSVTSAAGTLVATVGIGSNRTNRTITVTAASGLISKTATLQVVDVAVVAAPKSIEVIAASTAVGTGGDGVQITAFVKDENNNALAAAPVTFKADTGTLSSVSVVTNAAGAATASFASGAQRSNRTATITVTSGTITTTLTLPITGTTLKLSGPTALIVGNTATFDVVATDSKSNPISGVPIAASSFLNNALAAVGSTTTNASGQVRYSYAATNSGTDILVFSGAGASVSPSTELSVSAQDFSFVAPAANAQVDAGRRFELRVLLRSNGVAQSGRTINFAATSGTLSPSATASTSDGSQPACEDSSALLPAGVACVLLTSNSAGPLTVQATTRAADGSSTSTTLPLLVVARQPTNITLQISPTAIAPNTTAASSNIATVLAKVVDVAGNPVQGATVNFTRVTDISGGNLLQASAITDASGQASVSYRAGGQTTASNGVVLQASLADFPTVLPQQATLTVNQSALFIALGTGNVIGNLDPQTYKKDWVVYVTDANGIPVNGVTLAVKAIPKYYRTGHLALVGKQWVYEGSIFECRNEDANLNGIRDATEDDNGDGLLWPGNVISVTPGSVQTAGGVATVSLIYAESYAPWLWLQLTASATVAGTESKTAVEFLVSGSAPDFSDTGGPPAGIISPFGDKPKQGAVCTQVQ